MNYLTLICDLHQPTYTFTHTCTHLHHTHITSKHTFVVYSHAQGHTHAHVTPTHNLKKA